MANTLRSGRKAVIPGKDLEIPLIIALVSKDLQCISALLAIGKQLLSLFLSFIRRCAIKTKQK